MNLQFLLLAEAPIAPPWYQIATGVLAIPAAIIGLIYSYVLLKKTRIEASKLDVERQKMTLDAKKVVLESQKLEIEIREKLNTELPTTAHLEASLNAINTLFQTQQVSLLLLRFVVLYIALKLLELASNAYEYLFLGLVAATVGFAGLPNNSWLNIPLVVVSKLPVAVYWCMLIALGWPLFRDANGMLGLRLSDFSFFRTKTEIAQQSDPPKSPVGREFES